MKSTMIKAVCLASFIMLAGCETSNQGAYNYHPSVIEAKYLKQCATVPAEPPCGAH